jgi:hypothetical protein
MSLDYLQYVIDALTFVGVGGYALSQFVRGKGDKTSDEYATENTLNAYLKKQIESFKEIIADQDKKIQELGKQLAALSATLLEKDKTIDTYFAILQNRNPELEAFMKDQAQYRKESTTMFQHMVGTLGDISTQLNKELHIESTIKS